MIDSEPTEVGGYKRVAIMITGDKVYSKLKYEMVHTVFNGFQ